MHTRGICHGHPAIEIKFVINSLLFRYFLEKKNYLQYVLYNIYFGTNDFLLYKIIINVTYYDFSKLSKSKNQSQHELTMAI